MKRLLLITILPLLVIASLKSQKWISSNIIDGSDIEPINSTLDAGNNHYVLFEFIGNIVVQGNTINSRGSSDLIIIKFDAFSNVVWYNVISGLLSEYGGDVTISNTGGIYVSGTSLSNAKFTPTDSILNTGSADIFLASYSPEGVFENVSLIGYNSAYQQIESHAIDPLNNRVVISGVFLDSIRFDPGSGSALTTPYAVGMFVAWYDFSGNYQNAVLFGSNSQLSKVSNVKVGTDGYYLGGLYRDQFYYFGDTVSTANTNYDNYIMKIDFDGNYEWLNRVYGLGKENYRDIATDDYLNVYLLGNYTST
ncbi:MAG: hypothetical protein HC896_05410, partial [Bacteroidales bacterium]|nr:hypothetical protein [Bacteroidales bacterium]